MRMEQLDYSQCQWRTDDQGDLGQPLVFVEAHTPSYAVPEI
jgi:hypothetical protein